MTDSKTPLISVIMSVYNEKVEWMRESIDSILNQTFSDFEFIIINDNPTRVENSLLLEEYRRKDNRLIILINDQNIGLTKSLNKGIRIAKGKYIARMDADDISLQARFEKQIKVMENNPNIIVCGTKIKVFGELKNKYYLPVPETSNAIKDLLIRRSCIAHPTVLIRKNILIMNNTLYDENYVFAQDYKLWTDLWDFGDYYNIQETLLLYRSSRSHISSHALAQQSFFFYSARKEYVNNIIMKRYDYANTVDWDNITISTIRNMKRLNVSSKIIEVMYLSLKKYRIKEWLYFIFSFDFLRFSIRGNLSIIIRFLKIRK
jgi:glycosyltransferase involved in cell wall biosynthesis